MEQLNLSGEVIVDLSIMQSCIDSGVSEPVMFKILEDTCVSPDMRSLVNKYDSKSDKTIDQLFSEEKSCLSNPLVVAFIRAGRAGGCIENSLSKLIECDEFIKKIRYSEIKIERKEKIIWAYLLGNLLSCGVPILQALEYIAGSCPYAELKDATMFLREDIAQGADETCMYQYPIIPKVVARLFSVGWQVGCADNMLIKAAEFLVKNSQLE